jgi:predicted transcriptional regulator
MFYWSALWLVGDIWYKIPPNLKSQKKRNIYIGYKITYMGNYKEDKMAETKRIKIRYVDINVKKGSFVSRLMLSDKKAYDFSDISLLRKILSNEKAKILYILKTTKPKSIYSLAKDLDRDFKSVREDLKILERFGFIEFHSAKTGRRRSLVPVLIVDKLEIIINI